MSEEMNDALRKYAQRVESYRDQSRQWKEVQVRRSLIEPLLGVLLWDPTDPNYVRHEFPVTMGSETRMVDYALMSGDTAICVVEAKAGELDEASAKQALSYARNLNVPWAIVTNGQRLCLYGIEFYTAENVMDALVMDIEVSPDNIDVSIEPLGYLRNGTLDSEEVNSVFKSLNERRALFSFLESRKDFLVNEVIAKWVKDHWNRGPVDRGSLINALEHVFGRVEVIAETTQEKTAERQVSIALTPVVAGDFRYRKDTGRGIFEWKTDPSKRIDVSVPGPELERQLERLGLRTTTRSAFGGFRYNLRREAGLIRGR